MADADRKCDYADERDKSGFCAHKRCRCNGCGDLFVGNPYCSEVDVVERKDICKKSSLFGNYYITLTTKDIVKLQEGQCLALTEEEYNIFISCSIPQEKEGNTD